MEVWLITCLIVLLAVLIVAIVWLVVSLRRMQLLEARTMDKAEAAMKLPDTIMPAHLDERFEQIAEKQLNYFDTLLQTTLTSFDTKLVTSLDKQQQLSQQEIQKQFGVLTQKLQAELDQLTASTLEQSKSQLELVNSQTKKIDVLMRKRLAEHFTEIAWQYISTSLQDSLDLHSQKDMIAAELRKNQAELKKDYHAA